MNIFDGPAWNKWMSLTVLVLLISIAVTVHSLSLQKEIRQQAENSCKVINAECSNNQSGNQCCSGLQCVVTNTKNGKGKCELAPTPVPTTYTPPTDPTSPPYPTSGEGAQNTPVPEVTSTTENGVGSADPVVCGPNGCGWSPRPEGEKSTNNAPNIQVCTLNFSGPKQLIGTRLSSTSIRFNWWPAPGGADRQLIQYGLESGNPQWGLINISGDQGQIVVDHLPANSTIWAQVRAYKGNCYEDTDWISVTVPEQTVVTPTITVFPTSISMHAVSYFASTVDSGPYGFAQSLIEIFLLGFLLLLLFILILRLILLLIKRKRKKKED